MPSEKINPPRDEEEYNRAMLELALEYCPRIYACKKCEWPVMSGYCCNYCGTSDPYREDEEE